MRYSLLALLVLFGLGITLSCQKAPEQPQESTDAQLHKRANELAHKFIIVDTHVDIPYRLDEKWEDISQSTPDGDFDYPRARAGGLDAPFMSIYVPASYQKTGGAKEYADHLIDMVDKFATDWPDKFAIAKSVADVRQEFAAGKIALPMGMENGAPVENDLANLQHFYERGIRYITLTHSKVNQICDSSYDPEHKWHGLSPFGKKVVAEMNRLGIMVDISHVSDDTFNQVMELSKAPVIASHSSCRHFTPGWERNMSDEMIRALADHGGVIQIAIGSSFLSDRYRKQSDERSDAIRKYLEEHGLKPDDAAAKEYAASYRKEHPIPYADISDVVAHIDHVVKLVGIDHVGIGSDFEGVGDSLPTGMKNVSEYPNLIYELLKKGYSEQDIQKICSGNLLRVWSQVEQVAQNLQSDQEKS